jgi:exonuclease III
MCLQETKIENNFDHNLLSFPGYNNESEINDIKSRVGTYVRKGLDYVRRTDPEGTNFT